MQHSLTHSEFLFFASSLIAFLMTGFMAISMYKKRTLGKGIEKFSLFLFCVTIGILGDFIFITPLSDLVPTMVLVKLTQLVGFFMAPLLLDSIIHFLDLKKGKIILGGWYLLAFASFMVSIPTNLLIASAQVISGKAVIVGGPLLQFLTVQILVALILVFALSIYSLINTRNQDKTTNIKLLLFSYVFICLSASIYFLNFFGTNLPRLDNIFLAIFLLIIAYAITKHELMDIKIVINKAGAFVVTVGIFILGYLALFVPYQLYVTTEKDMVFVSWTCVYWITTAGLYFQRLQRFLQTTAYKKFLKFDYDFDETLKSVSSKLIVAQSTNDVIETLMLIQDSLEIGQCYAFLRVDDQSPFFDCYRIEKTKLDAPLPCKIHVGTFDLTHPLLHTLDSQFQKVQRVSQFSEQVQQSLQALGISMDSVCMSVDSFKAFQAVFIVGQRLSEEPYADKDIALFEVITNQAVIVFERITQAKRLMVQQTKLEGLNTQLQDANRDLETKVNDAVELAKKHFHQAAFATLASGMAHEIRNPMAAILACAGFVAESIGGRKMDARQEFGEWERPITSADFLIAAGNDPGLAQQIVSRLIETGALSPSPMSSDVLNADVELMKLPEGLGEIETSVRTTLMGLGHLATLFDFLNIVNQQIPRILEITHTMMRYGVSGGGVKPDSFTKLQGVTEDDSGAIFNVLLGLNVIESRGSTLSAFNVPEPELVRVLEKALPARLRDMGQGIIRLIQTTPGAMKQPISVRDVLTHTIRLLEGMCKTKRIKVIREIPEDLPAIAGDDHRLQQAFFNIMFNAIQALEQVSQNQREIIVRVERAAFRVAEQEAALEGVKVEIEDTGPGISPEIRAKMFNPFFTTKGPTGGKNIGLGLSILMEVVAGHNGVIEVDSIVGVGTTFKVFLPEYVETRSLS